MKKIISISLLSIGMLLLSGCAGKSDVEAGSGKRLDIVKKEDGYVLKPLQYSSAKLITGVKNLSSKEPVPVVLQTDNCRILGSTSANDYTALIKLEKVYCSIEGTEYESSDIQGWVMKDNYIGLDLTKKEVEKREDLKKSQEDQKDSLYGLQPGQEVKLFIKTGTLNKL